MHVHGVHTLSPTRPPKCSLGRGGLYADFFLRRRMVFETRVNVHQNERAVSIAWKRGATSIGCTGLSMAHSSRYLEQMGELRERGREVGRRERGEERGETREALREILRDSESDALAREHDEQVRVVDQSDRDPSEVEGHLASPGAGKYGVRSRLLRCFESLCSVECRGGGPEGCEV